MIALKAGIVGAPVKSGGRCSVTVVAVEGLADGIRGYQLLRVDRVGTGLLKYRNGRIDVGRNRHRHANRQIGSQRMNGHRLVVDRQFGAASPEKYGG